MAKRGVKAKGEYAGKTKVFSSRIRPDLRRALDDAALASGRSVSQEVERRLRESFIADERIADAFGGRRNFAVMRIIAAVIDSIAGDGDWLADPTLFEAVRSAVEAVLRELKPPGEVTPRGKYDPPPRVAANSRAAKILLGIQNADVALDMNAGTRRMHQAASIKSDLGDIAKRPKMIMGTADDIQRYVDLSKAIEAGEIERGFALLSEHMETLKGQEKYVTEAQMAPWMTAFDQLNILKANREASK